LDHAAHVSRFDMNPLESPLLTDLYQLTMLQGYFEAGMTDTAVFELFVRKLPPSRNFLVAAGLEQALGFAAGLRFADGELAWVESCGIFAPGFAERLARLRFTGEVHAMPEGTVFFPNEPILRVIAPLPEAQLLETRLVNLLHYETLVASKAARSRLAAPGKRLIDFGLRRAHGAEAGLLAARASWLAGFDGTATTLAAPAFGIPVFGTMAHSFVQAHADEAEAFEHFARVFPKNAVLLIDTYDTVDGARKAVALAAQGVPVRGVRLDSGDLAALAREVRAVLDAGGLRESIIFASGNLDEYRVRELVASGAPIDAFGIGTALVTSDDAPYLDMVYKLQEYGGRARRKRSAGKATWPGRKQVYRHSGADGAIARDVVTVEGDRQDGKALLEPVMRGGSRIAAPVPLDAIRRHAAAELATLPPALARLDPAAAYPVELAPALVRLAAEVDRMTTGSTSTKGRIE
jgi:nicotinate phosphoribosyltransferase